MRNIDARAALTQVVPDNHSGNEQKLPRPFDQKNGIMAFHYAAGTLSR
jgi:hypothetical protein